MGADLDYNEGVIYFGDDHLNKFYIYTFLTTVITVGTLTLTSCSVVPVVEHPSRPNVLEENFATEAKALGHELDTYDELMPLYPDDTEQALLEAAVVDFLGKDEMVKKEKLSVETMDLQLFEGERDEIYFAAVMQNKEKLPFTMLAFMVPQPSNRYEVKASCLAPYYANLPKTFLLKEEDQLALVSQRPFSTFEEVYFYTLSREGLSLSGRGWQDISLAYYSELNALLDKNKLEEAMQLPDESMYPMAYEALLFSTANKIIAKAVEAAKDEGTDPNKRAELLEWGLNYYTQNHYGQSLDELLAGDLQIFKQTDEVFGKDYLLTNADFANALEAYGNVKAKAGDENFAELLIKASRAIKNE